MNARKISILFAAAALSIGLLAGCGKSEKAPEPTPSSVQEETSVEEETPTETTEDDSAVIEISEGEGTGGM